MVSGWTAHCLLFKEAWGHLGYICTRRYRKTDYGDCRLSGMVTRLFTDRVSINAYDRDLYVPCDSSIHNLDRFSARRDTKGAQSTRQSARRSLISIMVTRR